MTGTAIRGLRLAAGLEPGQFALLVGVHTSTLYRWEHAGTAAVRVEPLQRQLLALLERELSRRDAAGVRELSKGLADALLVGGSLLGLHRLLWAAFVEGP